MKENTQFWYGEIQSQESKWGGSYRTVRVKSQNKFATLESLDESTGINKGGNLETSKSQLKRVITNRRMFNVCRANEVINENKKGQRLTTVVTGCKPNYCR